MKLVSALVLLVSLSSAIYGQEQCYAPGEVLAYFADQGEEVFQTAGGRITCAYEPLMSYLMNEGLLEAKEIYHGSLGVRNIYVLRFNDDANIPEIVSALSSFSEIAEVTPNYCMELLFEPNDYYYSNDWWVPDSLLSIHPDTVSCLDQWNITKIEANRAWDIQKGSPSVTVGILDTGVDFEHPDLSANIWVNPAEDLDEDGEVWDIDDLDSLDSAADEDTLADNLIGWDFVHNDNNPHPVQAGLPAHPHGT